MADTTIFSNQQTAPQAQPPLAQPQLPAQPVVSPNPFQPPPSSQPPQAQPVVPQSGVPVGVPPQLPPHNLKKILIGAVALIVVLLVGIIGVMAYLNAHKKPEHVTLEYWGLWEDEKVMKTIIADFERKNPLITVHYTTQSVKDDVKTYKQRVLTQMKQGNGPDIFRFHNAWLPSLYTSLLPLPSTVISPKEFTKVYYPVIASDLIKNGGIYGIPLQIDTLALYVNDDTFQAGKYTAPKSWYDFGNVAAKLTAVDGSQNNKITNAGAALGTFDNITHAPDIISLLFAQQGVNLKNIGKSPQQVADALRYYTSFARGDTNSPPVWDGSLNPSIISFIQGNLAMYFGYSWDLFTIEGSKPNFHYSIVPVPYLETPNGPIKTTIASYWVEGVAKTTKHPKEAFLFMHYLTQKDTLQKLYTAETTQRSFGELYPRSDMEPLLKDSKVDVFLKQAPHAVSTYFASSTYDDGFTGKLNTYMGDTIKAILGGDSVETAEGTLLNGFNQVLGKSQ